MRIVRVSLAALLVTALAAGPLLAQAQGGNAPPKTATIKFTEHKMKNGLRVVLAEDHTAPTYSIAVAYDVGSRDERAGRTGFAHLFEHMMFQGSENVGKREHSYLISVNGGTLNGTTDKDRTLYFETLPANQLDLGLWLEADRMRALDVNQANLDNQINAVQEERRLRVDNSPYGLVFFEHIDNTAYDNFAYKHSVIGSMEDLRAATIKDVQDFFRIYYAPNNAVLVLVGDFDSKIALQKIEKYFGDISSQKLPEKPDLSEPAQAAERRFTWESPLARTQRLDIAFKAPPAYTPDWYALDVLGRVLAAGQSSRLYQKMVRGAEVVTGIGAGPDERTGPTLFGVGAGMRPGKTFEEVEKMVYEEIDRIITEGVTDEELAKVRMTVRRQQAQSLGSTLGRAAQMADYAVKFGRPELINTYQDSIAKVTSDDVKRVARKYLTQNNRTVVTTTIKAQAPGRRTGAANQD